MSAGLDLLKGQYKKQSPFHIFNYTILSVKTRGREDEKAKTPLLSSSNY